MSAIVALTAQNTPGVTAIHEVPPDVRPRSARGRLRATSVSTRQRRACCSAAATIETVAEFLGAPPVPLVVDPVMMASSGARLLREDAVAVLVERLFPLAEVVTPNLPEACALAGVPFGEDADRRAARGGGCSDSARRRRSHREVTESRPPGLALRRRAARVDSRRASSGDGATHGAGCTHSAALAALLARVESSRRPPVMRRDRLEGSALGPHRIGRRHRGRWTSSALRLSDLGEFGLLAELARRGLAAGDRRRHGGPPRRRGRHPGRAGRGIHFRLEWTSWRDLGYKAAAVNLSDLAAAGADPEALFV